MIVLAEFDRPELAGALVEDDLGFIGADADDPERLDGAIRRARVFAGHAGWGPGQLEDELAEEAWIIEPPTARGDLHRRRPTSCGRRCCGARAIATRCWRRCRPTPH